MDLSKSVPWSVNFERFYCICVYLYSLARDNWQAYLEFFTSRENIECLREILPLYPQVNYHIINASVSILNTLGPSGMAKWIGASPGFPAGWLVGWLLEVHVLAISTVISLATV